MTVLVALLVFAVLILAAVVVLQAGQHARTVAGLADTVREQMSLSLYRTAERARLDLEERTRLVTAVLSRNVTEFAKAEHAAVGTARHATGDTDPRRYLTREQFEAELLEDARGMLGDDEAALVPLVPHGL